MVVAYTFSQMSHCTRKQVGCVLVKDGNVISMGWNGMPSGWDNCCEDCEGKTRPEVQHAEANAVSKLASSASLQSGKGATVYVTCSPCFDCAKLLKQIDVKEVFYAEDYHSSSHHQKGSGIKFLEQCGIPTHHFPINHRTIK